MDSLVGTSIGPYTVTKLLGQGGMGSVFEAVHQQIGRHVAIKILRAEHARDKETVRRLFNEARAVNRIAHPGLVQIFDCDMLPNGMAYLVMELLIGETLSERLMRRGRRLPELEAMRIVFQLASILDLTHKGGIVHRDLKPGEVAGCLFRRRWSYAGSCGHLADSLVRLHARAASGRNKRRTLAARRG